MSVVFSKDVWCQQGNAKVLMHVTADQSDSGVYWKAEPTAAQTLAYRVVIRQSPEKKVYAYYTYGNNAVYCALKINGTSYYSAQVVGSISSGRSVGSSGWISWGYSSNYSSVTTNAPWTDYTVDIVISGGGSSAQTIRIVTASTTPAPPPPPEPEFLTGAKTKNDGSWKSLNAGFVKVTGQWKEITNGYVKINGVWKSLT